MSQSISEDTVMVGKDLTFRTRYKSIESANAALKAYTTGIQDRDEWVDEENKMPIFLDTCVLLNLYDISETERVEFIKFIQKNKDRIYISSQVQREYIRRRLLSVKGIKDRVDKTRNDILSILSKLASIYKSERDSITNLVNRNFIKFGMPQVFSKLKEIEEFLNQPAYKTDWQDRLKQFNDYINQHIEEECEQCWSNADFEYVDPVQEAIVEAKNLPSLSENEQKYIVDLYKNLRIAYDAQKLGSKELETITFPGSGDKDKIVDGPIEESIAWGDLYIYHEMLRFMKENNTDVVFMTRDVTKEDWMKKDHRAYVHYIVNAYEMTGHLMYILDADGVVPTFNTIETKQEEADGDEISEKPSKATLTITKENGEKEEEKQEAQATTVITETDSEDFPDLNWVRLLSSSGENRDYRVITKEQLIKELQKTTKWAKSYGAGYVGESHFIYNILSHKRYDYSSIKEVLESLMAEGVVYRQSETHDGHTFNCLVLKEE